MRLLANCGIFIDKCEKKMYSNKLEQITKNKK